MLARPSRHRNHDGQALATARHLGEWISTARYPLHGRLPPERALCGILNVSRATLRIALKKLEQEGRIWRHVGKGTFVGGRPQSVNSNAAFLGADTTLAELLEARVLIEPIVARLAALRSEAVDFNLIERYHRKAAEAIDWEQWNEQDELLHRAIAEASGNGVMISISDQIIRIKRDSPWSITRATVFNDALKSRYVLEHRAIISAIANRDQQGAELAMRKHMNGIASTLGPALA